MKNLFYWLFYYFIILLIIYKNYRMNANSLGTPGKGFHFHIGGVAILDILATIGFGYGIGIYFNINPLYTIIGLWGLGEALHEYYGVHTWATDLINNYVT